MAKIKNLTVRFFPLCRRQMPRRVHRQAFVLRIAYPATFADSYFSSCNPIDKFNLLYEKSWLKIRYALLKGIGLQTPFYLCRIVYGD